MNTQEVASLVLMYGVVPLWIAAGLADWACHRRTRIERTSGLGENALHWVLLAEGGVALFAAVLLEPDAGVLLIVFAAFLAHELTTYMELRYTARRRQIRPFEQMVHSYMELLPLVLLALLAMMNWDQVMALFAQDTPDLDMRLKDVPWPRDYLLGAGIAVLLLNVVPLVEETWRCLRERRPYA
ncbi:hypothetical protein GCM10028796_24140 [Ramlibacter monticola]|uniref:Diguanylate cyclase n=1 Tax=Ramlibacter monticola TaxID=1926872 RepID=A0A937CUI3_9BURK|nr:diguanylate cyclase [Ramlibacter monticola]MBL0392659.1 diguanylate cyclase [Ramlibacter monticola]